MALIGKSVCVDLISVGLWVGGMQMSPVAHGAGTSPCVSLRQAGLAAEDVGTAFLGRTVGGLSEHLCGTH